MKEGNLVSFVTPKSLMNAPEFNKTREIINKNHILNIIDFGEYGFKGIKIETINIIISMNKIKEKITKVTSYINDSIVNYKQDYITNSNFKSWLIYRNEWFDEFVKGKKFNVFTAFRDRQITNSMLKQEGKYKVLKSKNIVDGDIINLPEDDMYLDDIETLSVKKFINNNKAILIPNLTYNPRACFMPNDIVPNGSLAILIPKENIQITEEDLHFYATSEFKDFYKIARNYGTRSLNIDNNSVEFFCIKEKSYGRNY